MASAISIASPEFYYFMVAGESYDRVMRLIIELRDRKKLESYFTRSINYWNNIASELADDKLAAQSIVVLLGHIGSDGSIPASLDMSIIKFNLDTYGYV